MEEPEVKLKRRWSKCLQPKANTEADMAAAIARVIGKTALPPVFVCIGSDLAIGDSLGPLVGTMLAEALAGTDIYVYGQFSYLVTARNVRATAEHVRARFPERKLLAIDAAVGDEDDVGTVKAINRPIRPGSGANKRLGKVGDASLLYIVTKKSEFSYSLLNMTRLGDVYNAACYIVRAILAYLNKYHADALHPETPVTHTPPWVAGPDNPVPPPDDRQQQAPPQQKPLK